MNSLQIKLDFRSGEPIYVQIVEQIQNLVATGILHPGDQLPTVRQLASELRVNFNTVARAYRLLDENALISTQQGRGTYLLDMPSAETKARLRQESLEIQIKRSIQTLLKQGYSLQEIEDVLARMDTSWQDQDLDQEEN